MRRTKIVATIGPASREPEVLVRMVEAGMDVARLNFSHGTAEEHAEMADRVRAAANRAGRQVAILQDLPGPKLRIGALVNGLAEIKPGDQVTFVCGEHDAEGDARRMYITWAGLAETVGPDEVIYLADGAVRLRVTTTRPATARSTAVEVGGTVASRQGLNIPGETASLRRARGGPRPLALGETHRRRPRRALSSCAAPRTSTLVRKHTRLPLIAKIEKPQAGPARGGDRARGRLRVVAARRPRHRDAHRGGADRAEAGDRARRRARPARRSPRRRCSTRWSPRPAPTRARWHRRRQRDPRRHDACMLSQESAVGQYPVGAVAMMAAIAERTELTAPYRDWNERRVRRDRRDPAYTLAYTACRAAHELGLAALVCPTLSGAQRG
jgi:pyruvate kinase